MTEKKIIAVVGATGAQGGGLAQAILDDADGPFAVRALTRNLDSDAARALASRGAEVVAADLDDPDSVRKAFDGAYGAFAVTAFWEYNSVEREQAHIRAVVAAARETGLEHVVWSTLPDTRHHIPLDDDRVPTLHGRYTVPHFDSKAEGDQLFLDAGVPTTFLSTTMYFESFAEFAHPVRAEDGTLVLSLPMGDRPLPAVAAEDIGRTAYGIFTKGTALVGSTVGVSGEIATGDQYAAKLSDLFGERVAYRPADPDAIRASGVPGADDIANMFRYYADASDYFTRTRAPEDARALNPRLQDFTTWLGRNRDKFRI
jgi:uncharacterized protein YbjT (DUF2867 family)